MEELLIKIEGPVLLWIQEYLRNNLCTPVMKFVTHLGDHGMVWIVLTVLFLLFARTRKTGVLLTFSLLLNTLFVNVILKNVFARTRPYVVVEGLEKLIEAQRDYSFPSGHTASSFAAAVIIYLMCPKRIGVPALVLAALISLSRLYVGVHFPTDVIGGALIGSAAALLVYQIYKRAFFSQPQCPGGV